MDYSCSKDTRSIDLKIHGEKKYFSNHCSYSYYTWLSTLCGEIMTQKKCMHVNSRQCQ